MKFNLLGKIFRITWICGWGVFSTIPDIMTRKYTKDGILKIAVLLSWFSLGDLYRIIPDWVELIHLGGIVTFFYIKGNAFLGGVRG